MKTNIIAEIGINHNGDIDTAKKLIDAAVLAGCDYVKFQKRNPDVCVPDSQKDKIRKTPWETMTYLEYKHKIEFGLKEYKEIDKYCREKGIKWFASVWDEDSIHFMSDLGINISKIPSALINDLKLCDIARIYCDELIVSTGMSTENEVIACINSCNPNVIMHTNSTYPTPVHEINLSYINYLKENYPTKQIGYSGHEYGLVTTFAAVAMGATWIERHITLDRTMWGSDHLASVEPQGLIKLVKGIRDIEAAIGKKGPRTLMESELAKRESLRKSN